MILIEPFNSKIFRLYWLTRRSASASAFRHLDLSLDLSFFVDIIYLHIYLRSMVKEFINALQKARFDLTQVEAQQKRLALQRAQLLKTIEALPPLVSEPPTH